MEQNGHGFVLPLKALVDPYNHDEQSTSRPGGTRHFGLWIDGDECLDWHEGNAGGEVEHPQPGFGGLNFVSLSLEQCLEDGHLTEYLRWFATPYCL